MPRRIMTVLVLLVLAVSGCFSGDPEISVQEQRAAADREEEGDGEAAGGEAEAAATFVAIDLEFSEAPGEVPAGAIEFTLNNEGQADHNVMITEPGESTLVDTVAGGESASNVVELEAGEYQYICSIPGHEATMNGTLTVTE